jgi:N-succinyldiaminopimelate aminotransferase
MPRCPDTSPAARSLRPSVFATLAAQFPKLPKPPIPLHLGDTYRQPTDGARYEHALAKLPKNAYAYTNPNGMPELRQAAVDRLAREGYPGLTIDHVHVTSGGTAAINTVLATWLQPGDEVLVMAPYWPLIKGMCLTLGAVPVEVPFYPAMREGKSVAEVVGPYVTEKTVAFYMCSPNNPCGTVLTRAQAEEVAQFCIDRDLWVLDDQAYQHYVYDGEQTFLGSLPGMAQRTATAMTVSKSYALAGVRVGFLVGDPAWLDPARRVATHSVYNIPLPCQLSALGAIETADPWIAETKGLYMQAADLMAKRLQAKFYPAQGGGYVFADLTEELGDKSVVDWIGELLYEGVCVSPGDAFGADFSKHVRICYTSAPLDQIALAIDILNANFERMRKRLAA